MITEKKMLEMYAEGIDVNVIAKEFGRSVRAVYKIASQNGIGRPVKEKKPKMVAKAEPMYREIPSHIDSGRPVDDKQRRLVAERISWRADHPKPWYLC